MRKEKEVDIYWEWHNWFAWYPIWVNTGHRKGIWIFWEKVQRKRSMNAIGDGVTYIRNLDGTDLV